ncbi:MAG: hypothetical protein OSA81_08770 [Longimicrobiales bacterium]|nr:hypothetical protein [Longimicrobiales bacterium]
MGRRGSVRTAWLLLLAAVAACGGAGRVTRVVAPEIQPLVGTWEAEAFRVTNDAGPSQVATFLRADGSSTMNGRESSAYAATSY